MRSAIVYVIYGIPFTGDLNEACDKKGFGPADLGGESVYHGSEEWQPGWFGVRLDQFCAGGGYTSPDGIRIVPTAVEKMQATRDIEAAQAACRRESVNWGACNLDELGVYYVFGTS